MEFGTGMGSAARNSSVTSAAGSATSFCSSAEYLCNIPYQVDTLRVDDLLNFSCNDAFLPVATSATNHVRLCDVQFMDVSSCFQSPQSHLDLYVPGEEAAELEWLSRFVDESFSDRIANSYQYACAILPSGTPAQLGLGDPAVGGFALGSRSMRLEAASDTSTVDSSWASSLLLQPAAQSSPSSSSSSSTDFPASWRPVSSISRGKKGGEGNAGADAGVRRCTHCAAEKTPQWRTGPLGPKTLCNACGVRYKSGRLVPEYRPAASPTFVLTQHSNSHRKVMELRRQKELHLLNNAAATSAAASWTELQFTDHHHQQQNGVC